MRKKHRWRWLLFLLPLVTLGQWWHHCATSGPRIVFVSARSGATAIYSMNADGHDVRQLTHPSGTGYCQLYPAVSPDGRKIVYCDCILGDFICVMDADGKNNQRITKWFYGDRCCEFSPDGQTILSLDLISYELYRNTIDGKYEKKINDGVKKFVCNQYCNKIYTTNGAYLYCSNGDGSNREKISTCICIQDLAYHQYRNKIYIESVDGEIYSADHDGNNLIQLSKSMGECLSFHRLPVSNDHSLSVSPDGMHIAYIAGINTKPQIFLMVSNGSHLHQLTNEARELSGPISFSPDGQHLLYTIRKQSSEDICTIRIDGSNRKVLTHDIESEELKDSLSFLLQHLGPLKKPIEDRIGRSKGISAEPHWLPEPKK